jgi:sulfite dehydrogenase (cytochrome) subunit B
MPVDIKAGAGADKNGANCTACHSLDYIRSNSPFLSPASWDAEVSKMINPSGYRSAQQTLKMIVDYFAANYGK